MSLENGNWKIENGKVVRPLRNVDGPGMAGFFQK